MRGVNKSGRLTSTVVPKRRLAVSLEARLFNLSDLLEEAHGQLSWHQGNVQRKLIQLFFIIDAIDRIGSRFMSTWLRVPKSNLMTVDINIVSWYSTVLELTRAFLHIAREY